MDPFETRFSGWNIVTPAYPIVYNYDTPNLTVAMGDNDDDDNDDQHEECQ